MSYGNPNCKTCSHADVGAIDTLLARNVPATTVAKRYGLTATSVWRHRKSHIDPALLRRLKAKAQRAASAADLEDLREQEATNLLLRVAATRAKINGIMDEAEKVKDYRAALLAIKTLHENFKIVGELVGQLAQGATTINQSLVISPDYLKLRALLIKVLAPFPAARIAVAKALRELESPAEKPKQIEAAPEIIEAEASQDIGDAPDASGTPSDGHEPDAPPSSEYVGATVASVVPSVHRPEVVEPGMVTELLRG